MLHVVATPIGNLEDITLRAISALSNADIIIAEDTRVTRVLLEKYNIHKEIISYHQHSNLSKIDRIINLLRKGKRLALVSDAGTPGINDPGGFLISKILETLPDTRIVSVPGPNAAIAALSISGFFADTYTFLGFPPHKKGRQKFFKNLELLNGTVVFFESKHRIIKTLESLRTIVNTENRPIIVARELTKQFETIYRGTIDDIMMRLSAGKVLGEFVIVIGPWQKKKNVPIQQN
jgi:16S rRNA (cytidine1402-2'-O)-methyltransferase